MQGSALDHSGRRFGTQRLGKPSIEVGIIGREGMTGLAIVMGYQRASHDTYVADILLPAMDHAHVCAVPRWRNGVYDLQSDR
jgi:hypothetical protein